MAKYTYKRRRTNGDIYWVVNPPGTWKEHVEGAEYTTFPTRSEALKHATALETAYSDALARKEKAVYVPEDSVDGLFAFFKSTNEFKKLKPNSKRSYLQLMQTASKYIGPQKAENITATQADRLLQSITDDISYHRAVHVMKLLRRVWFTCLRHGKVKKNPFQKMGLKSLPDRKVLWEAEQVDKFIETADTQQLHGVGTIAMLCYHLCQRPGDMRQLKLSNIKEGCAVFNQEKTNTEVTIPLTKPLLDRISRFGMPKCERTGNPYDRWLLVKDAAFIRGLAGLPDFLQLRDLRRTGATEMAEAGCTEDELRAVTGHQSRDVLSIYVRPTTKLAAAGVNKRFG